MSTTIYALLLFADKYYIGKTTKDVTARFKEHYEGHGSSWTKMYQPLSIIEQYTSENPFEEDVLTKKYMVTYGIDNVRGGSYTNIVLQEWQIKSLNNELKSAMDKCYKCGLHGHFASICDTIYNTYLNNFDTEEKISLEIDKMENARKMLMDYASSIHYYKYYNYFYQNEQRTRIEKNIEIEPTIIDTYNLRNYKHIDNNKIEVFGKSDTPTAKTMYDYFVTNNKIIYTLNPQEVSTNLVEIIYKIYIHRKKLERNANKLIETSGCKTTATYQDALSEINKKIELLYKKYATII